MFPTVLVHICAILGVGCLTSGLAGLRFFKDRAEKSVKEETEYLFTSRDLTDFIEKLQSKKVTPRVARDFYRKLRKTEEPVQLVRLMWAGFMFSGAFFIFSAIFGNFMEYEVLAYVSIAIALFAFVYAMYGLFYLGLRVHS